MPSSDAQHDPAALDSEKRTNIVEETEDSSIVVDDTDLPKVDGEWPAWGVIAACFIYEGLQWGFPLSFGIFQNYYIAHGTFKDHTSQIPTIGVLSTSILYLGSPVMSVIVEREPQWRIALIWIGWALQVVALLAASFCNSVPGLILTQGFMYSLGDLIVYMPMMSLINEWFVKRRGLAYGIVDASTGVTGVGYPFVLQALLDRYGPNVTLRAFAVFFVVATLPIMPLLKARSPPSPDRGSALSHYKELFRKPAFHVYSISNVFQGLGFFFPELFLPTFAEALGLDRNLGALLIALLSGSQAVGQLAFGYLSDGGRVSLHRLMFTSSFVAGVATLTLWGLATSLAPLVLYALICGFFASGFVVLYARMGTELTSNPKAQLASYGMYSAQKGLGNILEGPLSSVLWHKNGLHSGYGLDDFAGIVGFTGACMLLSALMIPMYDILGKCVRRRSH